MISLEARWTMANGEIQYRMKCPVCAETLLVGTPSARIPRHPAKGQDGKQGTPSVPCKGSGMRGIVLGTRPRPMDEPIT